MLAGSVAPRAACSWPRRQHADPSRGAMHFAAFAHLLRPCVLRPLIQVKRIAETRGRHPCRRLCSAAHAWNDTRRQRRREQKALDVAPTRCPAASAPRPRAARARRARHRSARRGGRSARRFRPGAVDDGPGEGPARHRGVRPGRLPALRAGGGVPRRARPGGPGAAHRHPRRQQGSGRDGAAQGAGAPGPRVRRPGSPRCTRAAS